MVSPQVDCIPKGNYKQDANVSHNIYRALTILAQPGSIVELRSPKTQRGTQSGYYDNLHTLAEDATSLSGTTPGVYFTLNPCNPDLLARGKNRLRQFVGNGETTSDTDILRRLWLPLDFDPIRPAGISSSAQEHDTALEKARDVQAWLHTIGFPDPLVSDSGNGAHLLYPIDLPNDAASRLLVKDCLEVLAAHFNDELVHVDTSTFNAARIWKLYGTMACKGDSTPERPHRLACLIKTPDTLIPVSKDVLQVLADMKPVPVRPASSANNGSGIEGQASRQYEAWARAALHDEVATLRATQETGRNIQLNKSAFALGQILGAGVLDRYEVERELESAAHFAGLPADEIKQTMRSGLEDGIREPRHLPGPRYDSSQTGVIGGNHLHIDRHTNRSSDSAENSIPDSSDTRQEAAEKRIYNVPDAWAVKSICDLMVDEKQALWGWGGYMGVGLVTNLTALWKIGKTTLLAYLLRAFGNGSEEFCGQAVQQMRVLVVSEESHRIWMGRREELSLGSHIGLICRPFRGRPSQEEWSNFVNYLAQVVKDESYQAVIVDTIPNLWPVVDEKQAPEVIAALTPFYAIASAGAAVLLVFHPTKADTSEGRLTRGSGAINAFADVILEMRRFDAERRDDCRRVLTSYSRFDETPQELVIELDKDLREYRVVGTKSQAKSTDRLAVIEGLLPKVHPGLTPEEIRAKWPEDSDVPKPSERTIARDLDETAKDLSTGICKTGDGKKGDPVRFYRAAAE